MRNSLGGTHWTLLCYSLGSSYSIGMSPSFAARSVILFLIKKEERFHHAHSLDLLGEYSYPEWQRMTLVGS